MAEGQSAEQIETNNCVQEPLIIREYSYQNQQVSHMQKQQQQLQQEINQGDEFVKEEYY